MVEFLRIGSQAADLLLIGIRRGCLSKRAIALCLYARFREVPLNLLHTPNQQRLIVKASFVLFLFVFYLAAQDGFNMAVTSRCIWASSADVRFSTRTGGKAGLGAGARMPESYLQLYESIRIIVLELHEYYELVVVSPDKCVSPSQTSKSTARTHRISNGA
jgi:hypothetical protein